MKSIPTKKTHVIGTALFAAAMALPFSNSVFAEAAPEKGIVAFKYLNYEDRDSKPDQERISVNAYSVSAMAPIAGKWSITTTYTNDSVSGASPSHHSEIPINFISGASKIKERRQAVDFGVTRYFQRGSLTLGSSYSSENDYISRSYSAQGSLSTEDNNTSFTIGGNYTTDTINPTAQETQFEKRSIAVLVGITKVLTKVDILQLNVGYSRGKGDFTDHYKIFDQRPDRRESETVMTRWNHHFGGSNGTSRLSYRYYTDTFGIHAHTFGIEYVQPVASEWTVIPTARYSSQNAADFYSPTDGVLPPTTTYYSLDQRLSAFGALTLGIKVEKRIAKDWLLDAKFENYEQRAGWNLTGGGDKGLAAFSARFIQLGLSRQF